MLKLGKTIYKIIMYKMSRGLRQIWKLGKTTYKNFCGQKQTNVETWKNNLQNYHVHEQKIQNSKNPITYDNL